jgi:hypothetical protein
MQGPLCWWLSCAALPVILHSRALPAGRHAVHDACNHLLPAILPLSLQATPMPLARTAATSLGRRLHTQMRLPTSRPALWRRGMQRECEAGGWSSRHMNPHTRLLISSVAAGALTAVPSPRVTQPGLQRFHALCCTCIHVTTATNVIEICKKKHGMLRANDWQGCIAVAEGQQCRKQGAMVSASAVLDCCTSCAIQGEE